MRECLPKEIYLNSIRVPFEDLILPIPKEYDTYLTSVYGDYMTPKKDGYKLIQ
jgi:lipopolysaccharide cholinephosphotransferase